MFDSLSEKLEGALKSITGRGRIDELNVATTMREIRRALLDADVNYQVARDFTERVKEQALGEAVLESESALIQARPSQAGPQRLQNPAWDQSPRDY